MPAAGPTSTIRRSFHSMLGPCDRGAEVCSSPATVILTKTGQHFCESSTYGALNGVPEYAGGMPSARTRVKLRRVGAGP
eukprot:7095673-Prymnesium_polylepis.1